MLKQKETVYMFLMNHDCQTRSHWKKYLEILTTLTRTVYNRSLHSGSSSSSNSNSSSSIVVSLVVVVLVVVAYLVVEKEN